jgi:hypothetical protein
MVGPTTWMPLKIEVASGRRARGEGGHSTLEVVEGELKESERRQVEHHSGEHTHEGIVA